MHCCNMMNIMLHREDVPVIYIPKFREYGIQVLDGGTSYQEINYCPWCGHQLPASMRYAWCNILEKMGLDPGDPEIPSEMQSDDWWQLGKFR